MIAPLGPEPQLEVTLSRDGDRAWLELDEQAHAQLDASQGDAVLVRFVLTGEQDGPPDVVEVVGVMGAARGKAKRRAAHWPVWLTAEIDFDRVEAVSLKRRRPV